MPMKVKPRLANRCMGKGCRKITPYAFCDNCAPPNLPFDPDGGPFIRAGDRRWNGNSYHCHVKRGTNDIDIEPSLIA